MAPRARERLAPALFIVAIAAATFVQARELASRLAQTADSAQSFVAAHAVTGGNVLLAGWHFPIDDYYFTDTLPYAGLEWLVGSRPVLLFLVPALTYSLFVLAALIASWEATRSMPRNLESTAAIGLLLAAPPWIGSWDPLLLSDMHVATVLAAFVALVWCARVAGSETRKLWLGLALPVLVCVTVASDPFALVFAFGPALAVFAAGMIVRPQAGPNARLAFLLLSAGIALGLLLTFLIAFAGGFTTEIDVSTRFVSLHAIWQNLLEVFSGLLALFGVTSSGFDSGWPVILLVGVRATALALAVAAVGRGVLRLFGRSAWFDRLLCGGILADLLACTASAQFAKGITPQNVWTGGPPMRFLVPAVLFGSVLAARQVPEMLDTVPRLRVGLRRVLGSLALIAIFGGGWLSNIARQPRWFSDNAPARVASWLERHKLEQGAGEYWVANLVTAMSGNRVQVRSVVPREGRLDAYIWAEDARFYARAPQFMIWQDANKTGVTFENVRASYAVCRTLSVSGYRIAVLTNCARP